jgi:hypothetical protein
MQLNQQRRQLLAIKGRMERDYNMISSRYLKLFNGLNSNLKQRVYELDKPTIDFAVREVEKVSNRSKHLTATIPVTQLESLALSQKIVASNVKFRCLNVINSMTRFLDDMNEQKKLINRILLETGSIFKNSTLSVPVIISEMNYDKFNNKNIEISVSIVQLNKQTQIAIKNVVMTNIENLKWQNMAVINKDVQNEFSRLITSSNTSQRVKEMAQKLFVANNYLKL